MIAEFLQQILGDQEGWTPIALRDKAGADGIVNRFTWFKWPEQSGEMVAFAEKHKNQDLYYSPILYGDKRNEKGKISRTPENALTTQVVYADADTAEPAAFRLPPSVAVLTSNGRYHCYWTLLEPVAASVASEICHRLTTAHEAQGSDSNGWSANKVLRIPGSVNTSHGFPEEVKVHYTGELYDVLDVSGAYDDVVITERAIMRPDASNIKQPDDLPEYGAALDKVSTRTLELATAVPNDDQDRSRLRYKLLLELMREPNLTFEEALSIGWHAPAARKWSAEDPRGFAGLTAEAGKAQMEVLYETGEGIAPPEPGQEGKAVEGQISLLLPHERERISGIRTFIDTYVDHCGTLLPKQNEPYARINAWTIMSLVYSDMGFIPRRGGKEGLNMYTMTWGETTTGKSAERKIMFATLRECFEGDPGYNLGGNASPSALGKKLLERDGKVSFYNKDEAHGSLKVWTTQDWSTGMLEDLAELYDGVVPPQLRTGDWEASGKGATTQFVMHLMGTPDRMVEVLNRDLFLSGFLARFQWCIGNPRVVSYDSLEELDSDGDDIKLGFDPMGKIYAGRFAANKTKLRTQHGDSHVAKVPIRIDADASKRIQDAKWQLTKTFTKDKDWDILEPSLVRMGVTIRKAASLLAIDDGRDVISLDDALLAIEAAEEWVTNLSIVARQVSSSEWERACDMVQEFVESKGGQVRREVVMRRFRAVEERLLVSYVGALINQGRLGEKTENGQKYLYSKMKEEAE